MNQWTRFSTQFDYYMDDTPEYILATITSGNGLYALDKSEAWYDDLELIYNGTDITEKTVRDLKAYYTNGEVVVRIDDAQLRHAKINIVDMTGRVVYSGMVENMQENRFRLNLENGIYIINLSTAQVQLSKKI